MCAFINHGILQQFRMEWGASARVLRKHKECPLRLFKKLRGRKEFRLHLVSFEHTVSTVMQMEFVGDGPDEFIVALCQLLLEAHEVLENLLFDEYSYEESERLAFAPGEPGRPSFEIGREILQFYVQSGFKSRRVSEMLGVSKSTVFRRLRAYGLSAKSE